MIGKVTVTFDKAVFAKAKAVAIERTASQFLDLGNAQITAAVWDYPVAPSPRDIVDRGALLRSGKVRAVVNGWEVVWDAPHAFIVHEGAVLTDGTKMPSRRWTNAARSSDLVGYFRTVYVNA